MAVTVVEVEAEAFTVAAAEAASMAVVVGFTVAAEEDIGEAVPTAVRVPSVAARGHLAVDLLAGEITTGAEASVADQEATTEPTGDRTAGSIHRAA
jgi:hypothetical protein